MFQYKQKLTRSTGDNGTQNVEIMIPFKHLINFWITLEMPLSNCEINFILTWSKNCVIVSNIAENHETPFAIADTKLYVPVVILSNQDISKLLQQLKSGFKRAVNWKKYQSKETIQVPNPYLNFLIDVSFQEVNRLFVLSFENKDDRTVHTKYYLGTVEIKNYNVMIDGQNIFEQPVKNDLKTYDNIRKIAISQGDDYTTGCLLDYIYFKKIL